MAKIRDSNDTEADVTAATEPSVWIAFTIWFIFFFLIGGLAFLRPGNEDNHFPVQAIELQK